MERSKKIGGKIVTYLGLLLGFNGIVKDCRISLVIGVFFILFGCLTHELNEK